MLGRKQVWSTIIGAIYPDIVLDKVRYIAQTKQNSDLLNWGIACFKLMVLFRQESYQHNAIPLISVYVYIFVMGYVSADLTEYDMKLHSSLSM